MSRTYILGANWKSNPKTSKAIEELLDSWKDCKVDPTKCEVVLCPTAIHGALVMEMVKGTGIEVCMQNISKTGCGAFTGEITAEMAKEAGYTWALVGHSERRALYGETIEYTVIKYEAATKAGLKVMFAIGESKDEREGGKTDEVNKAQLGPVLEKVTDWDTFVIAYEPVWAIGTGLVATPEQAQETQANIRAFVKEKMGDEIAEKVRIQYGGSASPDNIEGLASQPDIDGFLVGGASLKPAFTKMIEHLNGL